MSQAAFLPGPALCLLLALAACADKGGHDSGGDEADTDTDTDADTDTDTDTDADSDVTGSITLPDGGVLTLVSGIAYYDPDQGIHSLRLSDRAALPCGGADEWGALWDGANWHALAVPDYVDNGWSPADVYLYEDGGFGVFYQPAFTIEMTSAGTTEGSVVAGTVTLTEGAGVPTIGSATFSVPHCGEQDF